MGRWAVFGLWVAVVGCGPHSRGPAAAAVSVHHGGGLPDSTREMLKSAAADPAPEVRARALAVLLLADPSPDGGPAASAGLWDPSPWVQARVLDALAQRGAAPEARARLIEVAARPDVSPYAACGVLLTLAIEGQPSGLMPLIDDRLARERAPWRRVPCLLAKTVVDPAGSAAAQAELAGALESGAVALDPVFLDRLCRHAPKALNGALVSLLGEAEDLLVLPLTIGLFERGQPAGGRGIDEMLASEDPETRMGVVLRLWGVPGDRSTALLRDVAGGKASATATLAGLALAARGSGGPGLVEAALTGDSPELQVYALQALAEGVVASRAGGGSRAWERLSGQGLDLALKAERPALVAAGLALLGTVGNSRDVVRAEPFLASEDLELRLAAAEAIAALTMAR